MITGQFVIDGMSYGVADAELPEVGPSGLPSGRLVQVKLINIIDAHNPQLMIQIRVTPEQLVEFANNLLQRRVIPAGLLDLRGINGSP